MEESNAWRKPIDLIPFWKPPLESCRQALATGSGRDTAVDVEAMTAELLAMIRRPLSICCSTRCAAGIIGPVQLAGIVAYAAARRIAHFHTSNEFGDWDTALHTFTFANAVHQGLQRVESIGLIRGVFDAAMSIYLDRFLNLPSVKLPQPAPVADPDALLDDFEDMLNLQQQVNPAGSLVAQYLVSGGSPEKLMAKMGHCCCARTAISTRFSALKRHSINTA